MKSMYSYKESYLQRNALITDSNGNSNLYNTSLIVNCNKNGHPSGLNSMNTYIYISVQDAQI